MKVSAALGGLLADRRKTLNGKVAAARSRNPAFDAAALSRFLVDVFDPLLADVLAVRPEGGAIFVDAGFDMAVSLVEHGWAGEAPRAQIVHALWRDVAPRLAPAIAANARETLGALTNAAIKLAREPGVRIQDWMSILRDHGSEAATPAEFRALATLAAWRTGAAHLRTAALSAQIDSKLACTVVGAKPDADWTKLVAGFTANRWWTPDRAAPPEGHRLGAFTGLGGSFAEPPRLGLLGDAFVLTSAGAHFLLEADAYGATLRPIPKEDGDAATPARAARLTKGNLIQADDRTVPCDWPEEGPSLAQNADTIAIVSPLSHAVRVLPRALP